MYNEEQKYLDLAREQIIDEGGGTRYFDLKTEGGENYREILMRLPSDAKKNQKRMFELEAKERRSSVGRNFGNILPEEMEELNQLRELAKNPKQDFQSKHWEEPNVLAHMRVQDRISPTYTKAQIEDIGRRMAETLGVDPKSLASGSPSVAVQRGVITPLEAAQFSHAKKFKNVDTTGATQKVLHVEEIQSDWHQKAREIRKKEIERVMKSEGITKKDALARLPENYGYNNLTPDESVELQALLKREKEESGLPAKDLNRARELETRMADVVPDAPFKNNWHELAMKRLLNYAAENGYDKIAITPGAEQARRYDLSRYINEISYGKNPDGTYSLTAIDKDGKPAISKSNLSQSELEETVGKDMAKKIVDNQGTEYPVGSVSEGKRALTGLDLQVGGEGKQTIYDKMIPNYLNEFGKKYNVQVSPFDIEQPSANFDATEVIMQNMPLHGFDITPQMREEINTQGLPMFSGGGKVKRGGRVHVSQNPDTMLLDLISKN
jgi:hypothetical protein